jgi:glycerophosphoryl diester phosphodiesterase
LNIIAHRGASFEAPENTLAALRLAWHQHADAVEIDVQLSRDHHLVVIHDSNTRRTARRNRPVVRQTLAQLRALDAGKWKHHRWRGEKIPTLEEALETVPSDKRIFIEVKTRANVSPQLARAFSHSARSPEQITLIGFSFPVVQALKRAFPKIEVCWITVLRRHWLTRRWPNADRLIRKVKTARLDGLDLCANAAVTASLIKKIQTAGLKLYVWTVDNRATAQKFAHAGIDGLTTNRPAQIRKSLRGEHSD